MKNIILLLLLFSGIFQINAQNTGGKIKQSNGEFSLSEMPTIIPYESSKSAKWGIFFWEFGDGNYTLSYKKEPVQSFYKDGTSRDVKITLTPLYSKTLPVTIHKFFTSTKKNPNRIYDNNRITEGLTDLNSNCNLQVVPNQDMRLALHYKAPQGTTTDGTLFLFFNDKSEKNPENDTLRIDFPPFLIPGADSDEGIKEDFYDDYKQPVKRIDFDDFEDNYQKRDNIFNKIKTLYRQHEDVLVFKVLNKMSNNEERRLFLTLKGNPELHQVQDREGADYQMTIAWIPNGGSFTEEEVIKNMIFKATEIHDPNRIKVYPKHSYYRKNSEKELTYKVDFQNIGKDPVTDSMKIRVDFSPNLIDLASVKLTDSKFKQKGDATCPLTFKYRKDGPNCIKIDTVRGVDKDQILFTFYGIILTGKKDRNIRGSRKASKSFVEFSAKPTNKKLGKTRAKATIMFTEKEQVETNTARMKWRKRTAGPIIGYPLMTSFVGFNTPEIDLADWKENLSYGFYFMNAPMRNGISRTFEMSYHTMRFNRSNDNLEDPTLPPINVKQAEFNTMKLVDMNLGIGYQLAGLVHFKTSAGVSVPLFGETTFSAQYTQNNSIPPVSETIKFGIIDNEDPIPVFGQEIDKNPFFGFSWKIGFEVGSINNVAFGIANTNYFYPKAVAGKCLKAHTVQAYFRFGLFNLSAKK